MQERLNEVMVWAERWQLQVDEHKCCVLTGNNTPTTYHLTWVQLVNDCRDLDVLVDGHCLFKKHISSIWCKAYITINVIFLCFHTANVKAYFNTWR